MNNTITKTTESPKPIIFNKIIEDLPGGVLLARTDLPTTAEEVGEGTLIAEDATTKGLYHVAKTAVVQEALAGAATALKVKKNHLFVVGDFISNGIASTEITAIVTTNADYDLLTLTAQLSASTTPIDTVLIQGGSEVATGAVAKYTPDSVLGNTLDVTLANPTGSAIVRGSVREDVLPYAVHSTQKTALNLIRFA